MIAIFFSHSRGTSYHQDSLSITSAYFGLYRRSKGSFMTRSVGNSCFSPRYVTAPRRWSAPSNAAGQSSSVASSSPIRCDCAIRSGSGEFRRSLRSRGGPVDLRHRAEADARRGAGAGERSRCALVDGQRDRPVDDERGASALLQEVGEELLGEPLATRRDCDPYPDAGENV